MIKERKASKREIRFKTSGRIAETLDVVENNNFIKESTGAAVRGCVCINSQENIRGGILF